MTALLAPPADGLDLDLLAQQQCDVVSRAQLRRCAVTQAAVRWKLESGRWTSIGPLVVALQSGPLTEEQRQWAAVLSGGTAAVAGRSALALAGLTGFEETDLHILVPHGRRWPRIDGVTIRWHVSRRWSTQDLQPGSGVPRTRVERSVVDGAAWTFRPVPRAVCLPRWSNSD